jgi:hypothetical protein
VPKGVLVAQSAPATDRDEQYNTWYDDVHMVEVLKLAGFTSARRFRKVLGGGLPYLAIYEVEADDLAAAHAGLGAAAAQGELSATDTMARDPAPELTLYEQISER